MISFEELEKLQAEFDAECEAIMEDCEAEGYPACGSNYELRVDNLMWSDYYMPLFSTE